MIVPLLVAVLVLFDASLAGFRSAAGRDGRIDKLGFYLGAIRRGVIGGAIVVAANAAFVALLVASGAPWSEFVDAGTTCAWVFGAFAAATTAATMFAFSPVPEIRLLVGILVLGPLTLLRPIVIAGGLAVVAARSSEPRIWIAALVAGVTTLGLEQVLGRRYSAA